jgi:hypothetical protein
MFNFAQSGRKPSLPDLCLFPLLRPILRWASPLIFCAATPIPSGITYRRLRGVARRMAIQPPTQPSDRLNVPDPVLPDNCPTAVRVMPFQAPTECNVPSGSTCPLPPRMMIFPPTIRAGNVPV